MKLTVQIELLPGKEQAEALLESMKAMNAAATHAAEVGFQHKVYGQINIHHLCYYDLRKKFNLPAQMAVRAIGKAVEAFKRDKTICPVFNPLGAVPLDSISYRLTSKQVVSIGTLRGRRRMHFVAGDYFQAMLSMQRGQADLVYRDGLFFLYITVEYLEAPPIDPKGWLGVDLGIVNLATDSTGEVFSGKRVTRNRRRRATARKQHQRKGTRNARRKLKEMSGKQSRFQRDVNHTIAKRLVDKAKALHSGIVLEDLKGIRTRVEETVSRRFRRSLGNWGFAQLRSFVEYKARKAGIPVVTVDPRNTSRTCSQCGYCDKGNRKTQDRFKCLQCQYSANADFNAATNISRLGPPSTGPKSLGHLSRDQAGGFSHR